MYFTNPELYWSCTTISAAPQLFTGRISFFPSFLQPRLKQDFVPTTIDRIYQSIGAFPEIRLTAPSPAPSSVQVDPLRTSDSPAERSACRCTSPRLYFHY
ncbi:hypothetical protein N7461_002062 [Penicillium sp. DV-2018c]|nr:hypothetical protein N7461_002062 [Penicillium sp. DV-2018c]